MANGHVAPALDHQAFRDALHDVLAKGPRSQRAACELTQAMLRKVNPRVRKADVDLALEDLIEASDASIETWEGPRGAKMIGLPGSHEVIETPEDKAFRLAEEDPELTAEALRTLAGCRKATALEALNHARSVSNVGFAHNPSMGRGSRKNRFLVEMSG